MKQIRKRLTYANVMSSLAVFLILGGGAAFAAKLVLPKSSVGAKQLKRNAVTSPKVKNHSLRRIDFAPGQLPRGSKGDTGGTGSQGVPGLSSVERITVTSVTDSISPKVVTATCPAGKKVVGDGWENIGAPLVSLGIIVDEVVPNAALTSVTVTAREIQATGLDWSTRVFAICANVTL